MHITHACTPCILAISVLKGGTSPRKAHMRMHFEPCIYGWPAWPGYMLAVLNIYSPLVALLTCNSKYFPVSDM